MFGGSSTNPYDEIVVKTTDENLTSENWELILNLCDKVDDEGQEGARSVIASILKRLAHRNPNVQLYALSLAESLSKNCGAELSKEIASKAFTQGLEKLIADRNTHEKVKKRALGLIATWTAEFEKDPSLGVMEDCYNTLKGKGFKFERPQEPLPQTVDDEIRRKEEEELQRVLELSMQDKGGRGQWAKYSLAASSASSSSAAPAQPAAPASTSNKPSAPSRSASVAYKPQQQQPQLQAPTYQGGYVPAKTPSPAPPSPAPQQPEQHYQPQHHHSPTHSQPQRHSSLHEHTPAAHSHPQPQRHASLREQPSAQPPTHNYEQPPAITSPAISTGSTGTTLTTITPSSTDTTNSASSSISEMVTRVRALHTFEPTEPGELPFEKGDIIRVVDRGYKDWWRGQLKGRTGIFPVNYVEPMPEPTSMDMAREAEQEAAVFSQAVNVEKLLSMLRNFDPHADNLADNEEIQELYRSCMALRPKIVKLIDKYSQKRADLVSMNETFIRARAIFDQVMEESLARHTATLYDSTAYRTYGPPAADPRARVASPPNVPPGPQGYSWNPAAYDQSGYGIFPTPAASQHPQHDPNIGAPYPTGTAPPTIAPGSIHPDPTAQYGYMSVQGGYHGSYPAAPYPAQGPTPAPYAATPGPQPTQQTPAPHQQLQAQVQPQPQPQPQVYRQDYQQQPAPTYSPQAQTQAAPIQATQPQTAPAQQYPNPQQQPQQYSPEVQFQALPQTHAQPQQQYLTIDTTSAGQVHQAAQPQPQPQPQPQQAPQGQVAQAGMQGETQSYPIQGQVTHAGMQGGAAQSHQTQTQTQVAQVGMQGGAAQPHQTQTQVAQVGMQGAAAQSYQTQTQVTQAGMQGGAAQSNQTQTQVAQASKSDSTTTSAQSQTQPQSQQQSGPPFVFDPYTTYEDPNVQAWAQYYAQGGKDPAGAVYFYSVPGVTDEVEPQLQAQPQQEPGGQQQQGQDQDQFGYQQNASSTSLTADGTAGPIVNVGTASSTSSPTHARPEQYSTATGSPGSNQNRTIVSQSSYSSLANATSGTAVAGTPGSPGRMVHGSPNQPSWVLPRRNTGASSPTPQASVPAGIAALMPGGYAPGAGATAPQPYQTLPNQFAGMSVAEHQ